MRFVDRADAGRRLAERLGPLPADAVVLGLPRGGVVVAAAITSPPEVLVVRKLGVPGRREVALGAIAEGGVRFVDPATVRAFRVRPEQLEEVERLERLELDRRVQRYRGGRPLPALAGRTAVLVDDGVATGATAVAACRSARAAGAARVVLAVPVAAAAATALLEREADELVALLRPADFSAVGEWYERFEDVPDEAVVAALTPR
ncbi:MAG: phosphoribosyltransferase family protein [Amnibacterium sp.]